MHWNGKGDYWNTFNYWFYNLVLFHACGQLCALSLYNSLCLYTTGRFYASTMLLYVNCEFCFMPLYVSTHLRFYGSLCFYTTGRLYACTMLLHADCQFWFTPLYDSTHLRFYGSLCFYASVRFYPSTMLLYADCQLFYTSVRFYASTFLRLTLYRKSVLNRNPG